jgi:hypothetical protein
LQRAVLDEGLRARVRGHSCGAALTACLPARHRSQLGPGQLAKVLDQELQRAEERAPFP